MLFLAVVLHGSHLMGTAMLSIIFHFCNFISSLPEVKLVCLRSCRFSKFANRVRQLDLMLCDPLHKETLEFSFHFTFLCSVSTRHSCAVANKRPLLRLYLDFRIHSSNDAGNVIVLLDALHVLLQALPTSCSTPQDWPHHTTCAASTLTETGHFPVPILYFCENV